MFDNQVFQNFMGLARCFIAEIYNGIIAQGYFSDDGWRGVKVSVLNGRIIPDQSIRTAKPCDSVGFGIDGPDYQVGNG